jgi:hypothetical protein
VLGWTIAARAQLAAPAEHPALTDEQRSLLSQFVRDNPRCIE